VTTGYIISMDATTIQPSHPSRAEEDVTASCQSIGLARRLAWSRDCRGARSAVRDDTFQ